MSPRKIGVTELALRDAHPTLIETRTVPYLLHHLPTHIEAPPLRVRVILCALARLCTTPALFPLFSQRVWDTLEAMGACEADAAHVGYVCALIVALHVALEGQGAARGARGAPLIHRRRYDGLVRPD